MPTNIYCDVRMVVSLAVVYFEKRSERACCNQAATSNTKLPVYFGPKNIHNP